MSSSSCIRPTDAKGRGTAVLAIGALGLLLVVGVVVWWLTRDDAPEEANLETATASVSDAADDGADGSTDDGAVQIDGIEGDWTVDTSVGEFSFTDSTGTFVGFRVGEELSGVGETEAVGRTPVVSGTVTIVGESVTAVSIEADMTALTTDNNRRDNRVHGAVGSDEFPTASFELTAPIDLGPAAADGEPVTASASGDLTVHGETNPVTFDLDAQLVDGTVVIVGSTEISFADYGVTVPSAPIVLSANDFGTVELQLFLIRG